MNKQWDCIPTAEEKSNFLFLAEHPKRGSIGMLCFVPVCAPVPEALKDADNFEVVAIGEIAQLSSVPLVPPVPQKTVIINPVEIPQEKAAS